MKELVFKIINKFTEKVDTYHNNGSIWLIFTDDKKWVIELTKDGTLWYNFYFFKDCFKYLSLDVIDNQHYITEWVKSIIQNGVKHTLSHGYQSTLDVKSIIQNGIKETIDQWNQNRPSVKDVIEKGIKETLNTAFMPQEMVEEVLENGIKETIELPDKSGELNGYGEYYARQKNMTYPHTDIVNDVITDGVKETNWRKVDNHPTYLDHILIKE